MTRIYLIGFMACGKTTLGKHLAKKLSLSFVDLDKYIESKYYKTIANIFESVGESGFREIERKMLEEVSMFENVVVSTGGGTPCFFNNMKKMNDSGTTIFLNTSTERIAKRLKESINKRPLIKDKKEDELISFINEKLKERMPMYSQAKHTIDSTFLENIKEIEDTVKEVIRLLE